MLATKHTLRLVALLIAVILLSSPVLMVSAHAAEGPTSTPQSKSAPAKVKAEMSDGNDTHSELIDMLENLKDAVSLLTTEELGPTADNRKEALCNKIDALENMIAEGNYNGALQKLEHDIIPKLDSSKSQSWIKTSTSNSETALGLTKDIRNQVAEPGDTGPVNHGKSGRSSHGGNGKGRHKNDESSE